MGTLAEHAREILNRHKDADHVKIHIEGEAYRMPKSQPVPKRSKVKYKPQPMPVYITDKPKKG